MVPRLALIASFAVASGCVISPVDDETVSSRVSGRTVSGYASADGARVQIRSWSYLRNAWEPIRDVTAGSPPIGTGVLLYPWSAPAVRIGARYWVPPGAPCGTGGMGRFEVRERIGSSWLTLKTFDLAGWACLGDEINAGTDYYDAGVTCNTGDNVLMFAPPACVTVPATDPTPPVVILRATDDERAWEVAGTDTFGFVDAIPAGRALRLRADAFDLQGARSIQLWYGATVVCRNGATMQAVATTFAPQATQSTPVGASVDPTLGAAADLTRDAMQAVCSPGFTVVSAQIVPSAVARNAAGTTATTPAMQFTMTF